jgi:hypothetical protein
LPISSTTGARSRSWPTPAHCTRGRSCWPPSRPSAPRSSRRCRARRRCPMTRRTPRAGSGCSAPGRPRS